MSGRLRVWLVLGVLLVVLVGSAWFRLRAGTALRREEPRPAPEVLAAVCSSGGPALWMARPDVHLPQLAADLGIELPSLPRLGPLSIAPLRDVLWIDSASGVRIAARWPRLWGPLLRLAGRLGSNPWLAGGEVGNGRMVRWSGSVWWLDAESAQRPVPRDDNALPGTSCAFEHLGPAVAWVRPDVRSLSELLPSSEAAGPWLALERDRGRWSLRSEELREVASVEVSPIDVPAETVAIWGGPRGALEQWVLLFSNEDLRRATDADFTRRVAVPSAARWSGLEGEPAFEGPSLRMPGEDLVERLRLQEYRKRIELGGASGWLEALDRRAFELAERWLEDSRAEGGSAANEGDGLLRLQIDANALGRWLSSYTDAVSSNPLLDLLDPTGDAADWKRVASWLEGLEPRTMIRGRVDSAGAIFLLDGGEPAG